MENSTDLLSSILSTGYRGLARRRPHTQMEPTRDTKCGHGVNTEPQRQPRVGFPPNTLRRYIEHVAGAMAKTRLGGATHSGEGEQAEVRGSSSARRSGAETRRGRRRWLLLPGPEAQQVMAVPGRNNGGAPGAGVIPRRGRHGRRRCCSGEAGKGGGARAPCVDGELGRRGASAGQGHGRGRPRAGAAPVTRGRARGAMGGRAGARKQAGGARGSGRGQDGGEPRRRDGRAAVGRSRAAKGRCRARTAGAARGKGAAAAGTEGEGRRERSQGKRGWRCWGGGGRRPEAEAMRCVRRAGRHGLDGWGARARTLLLAVAAVVCGVGMRACPGELCGGLGLGFLP